MAQEGNQRKQSVFTNSEVNSYEHHFSSMSYVWMDGRAMIQFAPIFDEFIGKQPKKGDNVFDYESKLNFAIDAQSAYMLLEGIRTLDETEELKQFTMAFGSDKYKRQLTIFKPGTLKLKKIAHDNYIIRVSSFKDEEEQKMYHILQKSSVSYKTFDGEDEEVDLEVDLNLMKEFAREAIRNAFGNTCHQAKRAGGAVQSSGRSARRSQNVEEEDVDDEGGDKPTASNKKASGKKADLDSEFDE